MSRATFKLGTPVFKTIKLSDLKLDPDNPRLPKSMHGKNERQILKFMLLDASLIELMLAIGVNDFFPGEQLLVVREKDGKYKAVEGNRRLSALKLLSNPSLADIQKTKVEAALKQTKFRPKNIPCLVFQTEEGIHNYLGYRHITGIKEWRLLEKARYLNSVRYDSFKNLEIDEASKEIAKIIGSKSDYVKRILIGFKIYKVIEDEENFYNIKGLDDTTFYFNYIADSLSRSNIATFLGVDLDDAKTFDKINKDNLNTWTHWLFEKNDQNRTRLIGDSYDLNSLNKILGNPDAREAFEEGATLERALELTGEIDEKFEEFIRRAIEYIENADRLVVRVKLFYPGTEEDLRTIRSTATKIVRAIQDREDEI